MQNFLKENKQLFLLAVPLVFNYFVEGWPNFANNIFLAHLGEASLAAGAIVSASFSSILLFFYGILAAVSTLIAHHYGAKEHRAIGEIMRDSIWIGLACSVILSALLWYGSDILRWVGQPPALVELATPYLHGLLFAVVPDFATMILWQLFIGIGKPKVTLISSLLYVPIGILANYTLMFGHFGFPALGMFGIGLGTAVGFWVLLIGFIIYIYLKPEYHVYFKELIRTFKPAHLMAILRIGLPMGVMFTIDLSFLMLAVFFAGKIGTTEVAAQQIGMQVAGLTFIIFAGLAQAVTVRIGHTWGAKQYHATNAICLAGVWMMGILSVLCSLLLWFKPLWIIGLDFDVTDPHNAEVVALAVTLLGAFGFFQLSNSFRYALFAVLRGLKDTLLPAFFSLIGFYGIAVGIGYPLLFSWHGTLYQFWILTSAATALIAVAMYVRFCYVIKKQPID